MAIVLHWRILAMVPKDAGIQDLKTIRKFQLYTPLLIIKFTDSHFHLDTLLKRVGSSDFFQFTIEKEHNDKIEHAIANYFFQQLGLPVKREMKFGMIQGLN